MNDAWWCYNPIISTLVTSLLLFSVGAVGAELGCVAIATLLDNADNAVYKAIKREVSILHSFLSQCLRA